MHAKKNGERTYLSSVDQRRDSFEYTLLYAHHTPSNQGIARPCTHDSKNLPIGYFGPRCRRYMV
jgi:hypothetical protein